MSQRTQAMVHTALDEWRETWQKEDKHLARQAHAGENAEKALALIAALAARVEVLEKWTSRSSVGQPDRVAVVKDYLTPETKGVTHG